MKTNHHLQGNLFYIKQPGYRLRHFPVFNRLLSASIIPNSFRHLLSVSIKFHRHVVQTLLMGSSICTHSPSYDSVAPVFLRHALVSDNKDIQKKERDNSLRYHHCVTPVFCLYLNRYSDPACTKRGVSHAHPSADPLFIVWILPMVLLTVVQSHNDRDL